MQSYSGNDKLFEMNKLQMNKVLIEENLNGII